MRVVNHELKHPMHNTMPDINADADDVPPERGVDVVEDGEKD